MNSSQKLATVLLRLAGFLYGGFLSLGWALYIAELKLGVLVQHYPKHTLLANLIYIVVCGLLVLLARPLGRVLGCGLPDRPLVPVSAAAPSTSRVRDNGGLSNQG